MVRGAPAAAVGGASAEAACAASGSYLGESGARDALEGLMVVLRQRLAATPAPLEPWAERRGGGGAPPLDAAWYRRRAKWYAARLEETNHLSLIEAVQPAHRQHYNLDR